jgi:CRP/FNR family transcriptional regulator, cyclic AMP receptor protein
MGLGDGVYPPPPCAIPPQRGHQRAIRKGAWRFCVQARARLLILAHDLVGEPVPTSPDHALEAMAKPLPALENLLSVLPTELAAALFATARPHRLKADQTLFTAGDPGDGCYRIEQGLLKVSVVSPSGGERILAILGPGALVGEFAMLDAQPRSASVTAARDSELSFISRKSFEGVAESHPEVYRHIVALLVRRLRDTNQVVAAMSFLSLKGRVAQALLSLAEAFGNDVGSGRILVKQKVTQSDLAAMAGIARENVSRILNDWMRAKLVSRLAGYYCLENRTALEKEAAM